MQLLISLKKIPRFNPLLGYSQFDNRNRSPDNPALAQKMQITKIRLQSREGVEATEVDVMQGFKVNIEYVVRGKVRGACVALNIHAGDGTHIMSLEDIDNDKDNLLFRNPGKYVASVQIPGKLLNSGTYLLRVGCGIPGIEIYDNIEAINVTLVETGDTTTRGHKGGYLLPMLDWQTRTLNQIVEITDK